MKQIGLISDTHLERCSMTTLSGILDRYRNCEAILHAGDIVDGSVLECLESVAPVHAVRGNMDFNRSTIHLPVKKIVVFGAFRVGLIHGWGAPQRIQQRVLEAFSGESVNAIVYGHSHHADIRHLNGCLLVNPGSPFDRRFAPFCSIGVLTLDTGNVHAEIVRL